MHLSDQGLIVILVVGLVAGWLAGKVVRGNGFGLVGDAAIGVARPGRAMPITFAVPGSWLPVCRRFPRMRQAGPQPLVADLVGDHSSLELVLRGVGKDIVERSTALQLHGFS